MGEGQNPETLRYREGDYYALSENPAFGCFFRYSIRSSHDHPRGDSFVSAGID